MAQWELIIDRKRNRDLISNIKQNVGLCKDNGLIGLIEYNRQYKELGNPPILLSTSGITVNDPDKIKKILFHIQEREEIKRSIPQRSMNLNKPTEFSMDYVKDMIKKNSNNSKQKVNDDQLHTLLDITSQPSNIRDPDIALENSQPPY